MWVRPKMLWRRSLTTPWCVAEPPRHGYVPVILRKWSLPVRRSRLAVNALYRERPYGPADGPNLHDRLRWTTGRGLGGDGRHRPFQRRLRTPPAEGHGSAERRG